MSGPKIGDEVQQTHKAKSLCTINTRCCLSTDVGKAYDNPDGVAVDDVGSAFFQSPFPDEGMTTVRSPPKNEKRWHSLGVSPNTSMFEKLSQYWKYHQPKILERDGYDSVAFDGVVCQRKVRSVVDGKPPR